MPAWEFGPWLRAFCELRTDIWLTWRLLCSSFLVISYNLFSCQGLDYATQKGTTRESSGTVQELTCTRNVCKLMAFLAIYGGC